MTTPMPWVSDCCSFPPIFPCSLLFACQPPPRGKAHVDMHTTHTHAATANAARCAHTYTHTHSHLHVCAQNVDITIKDQIRGEVTWNSDTLGDFVLLRSNGQPVYNFCVAIDDCLMAISHVIR